MAMRSLRLLLAGLAERLRASLPAPVKRALLPALLLLKRMQARRATGAAVVPAGARRRYVARERHAVFISDVPRVREAKLAHGLRRRGWKVSILYGSSPNYDLTRHFDRATSFESPRDAVRLALEREPLVYHVFSPSGDLPSCEIVNAKVGPIVFDATDILEISYAGNPESLARARHAIELQNHCIRHADAYCARDLQLKLAERRFGRRRGGPAIFFPEYCWGIAAERDVAETPSARPLRCVQAGNFGIEKLGEGDWGFLAISEKFVRAGVELHLYPNWGHFARGEAEFNAIFSDYLDLAARNPLIKLHRPVSVDLLNETLRPYDFGIYFVTGELTGQPVRSVNPESLGYCMGSRVFDYLDAGLPVLLTRGFRLASAMLKRYGAAVSVDAEFMDVLGERLTAQSTAALRRQAVRASRGLAIERHIHRLEKFYERVAADAGISAG